LARQKKVPEAIAAFRKAIELEPEDAAAYSHLGAAFRTQKKLPEAIAAYHKAIDLDPNSAHFYGQLGLTLRHQKKIPEAIAALRKAIDLDPKYALAYGCLGDALFAQKKLPEAIAAFRKAIEVNPRFASAYSDLGDALFAQKNWPESIVAYRKYIDFVPKSPSAYRRLGKALYTQGKLPDAISAFQKAIDLDPKHAWAHYMLATILRAQKKLDQATEAYHRAIHSNPSFAGAHCDMGLTLLDQGDFYAALNALKEGHRLGTRQGKWPHPSAAWVKQCQDLLELEKKLSGVLNGEAATASECLSLARMCTRYKARDATAAYLYQKAFKAEPSLAEDLSKWHRYSAACAAALAASGRGNKTGKPSEEEPAKLRQQAHAWLQADLDRHANQVRNGKLEAVLQSEEALSHWQKDADLTSVRDPKEIDKLPGEEAKVWQALWADVARLLKEARGRFTNTRIQGELTDAEKTKIHPCTLLAGRTYVIELQSAAFDAFLKLEDPQGKLLAENDDIVPGVNRNSRLVFTAPRDGSYRIVATSFEQAGQGAYALIIREFMGRK
jgi:tetratricopeptide (TPR) repeat protein